MSGIVIDNLHNIVNQNPYWKKPDASADASARKLHEKAPWLL